MVMRRLKPIGYFFAGCIFFWVAISFLHSNKYLIIFPKGEDQLELLSIFLAVATLIMGAVAIIVALVAVVGYSALKDAAATAGREAGASAAENLLQPMVRRELANMTAPQRPDRTQELTEALSERGSDVGATS